MSDCEENIFMCMLPYPLTVNHYWGRSCAKTFLTKKARIYREHTVYAVQKLLKKKFDKDVVLEMTLFPPDRRKRDIDNTFKSLLDALTHAKVWNDDSQVKKIVARMLPFNPAKDKKNIVIIRVSELKDEC